MHVRLTGCVVALGLAGCVDAPPPTPPPDVVAEPAPRIPPPIVTKRVWVEAGWQRRGEDHVWVAAHYVTVRVRYHHWVHEHRTSSGRLIPAHWEE